MIMNSRQLLCFACLALLASCANPINDYTRARYYEAGMEAERLLTGITQLSELKASLTNLIDQLKKAS